MAINKEELWLISFPNERNSSIEWESLEQATKKLSINYKIKLPNFHIGTFNQLMGLSIELTNLDSTIEQVFKKLIKYFCEILKKSDNETIMEYLLIDKKNYKNYLITFLWDEGRYPPQQPLYILKEFIIKRINDIHNEFKKKFINYNAIQKEITNNNAESYGSLIRRDLAQIAKENDLLLNSKYLETLFVLVPRNLVDNWLANYMKFSAMVVPNTSRLIEQQGEHMLFAVVVFRKFADEFKVNCIKNRFIVRNFVYNEETLEKRAEHRQMLQKKCEDMQKALKKWLSKNSAELYIALVHTKLLRVFVESILRYGIPADFQVVLIEPMKDSQKKVRNALQKLYQHLDAAAVPEEVVKDNPTLNSLVKDVAYPYVFFKLAVDFEELELRNCIS